MAASVVFHIMEKFHNHSKDLEKALEFLCKVKVPLLFDWQGRQSPVGEEIHYVTILLGILEDPKP